jgi:hypothetical protein
MLKCFNATMLKCYNATIVMHEIEDSAKLMLECRKSHQPAGRQGFSGANA